MVLWPGLERRGLLQFLVTLAAQRFVGDSLLLRLVFALCRLPFRFLLAPCSLLFRLGLAACCFLDPVAFVVLCPHVSPGSSGRSGGVEQPLD